MSINNHINTIYYIYKHQIIIWTLSPQPYFFYHRVSGTSLLVKPITEPGQTGTQVYFPGQNQVSLHTEW